MSVKILQSRVSESQGAPEPFVMFEKRPTAVWELLEAGQEIVDHQSIRVAGEQRRVRKKGRHGDSTLLRKELTAMAMFENYN